MHKMTFRKLKPVGISYHFGNEYFQCLQKHSSKCLNEADFSNIKYLTVTKILDFDLKRKQIYSSKDDGFATFCQGLQYYTRVVNVPKEKTPKPNYKLAKTGNERFSKDGLVLTTKIDMRVSSRKEDKKDQKHTPQKSRQILKPLLK